jgi:hypothetical protein
MISEQWLAEATYEHIRRRATREQMSEIIDVLLSDNNSSALTKNVVIRMAMIFSAEEGHS